MRKFFHSNVFVPTDLSAEAKSLIKNYQDRRGGGFVWYRELGKDLIKFIDRPDFIIEVLNQIASIYIGFMAAANAEFVEALSLDQIKNSLRFGGTHDGEHWLTKSVGAQVKATAGIRGTALTYYYQGFGLWNVMILLESTQIVLIIKDLVNLGPKFTDNKKLLLTTPDDPKTKQKDESKFLDKNGNPISNIILSNGDIIGTTNRWETDTASKYYSGYDGVFGTFHFAFMKKEFIQYYRSNATGGSGVAPDDLRNQMEPKEKNKTPALSWYISALSPESPVKCFK